MILAEVIVKDSVKLQSDQLLCVVVPAPAGMQVCYKGVVIFDQV